MSRRPARLLTERLDQQRRFGHVAVRRAEGVLQTRDELRDALVLLSIAWRATLLRFRSRKLHLLGPIFLIGFAVRFAVRFVFLLAALRLHTLLLVAALQQFDQLRWESEW